jgi:hypothetical protein
MRGFLFFDLVDWLIQLNFTSKLCASATLREKRIVNLWIC